MKRRRIDVNLGELDQLPRGSDGANPVGGLIATPPTTYTAPHRTAAPPGSDWYSRSHLKFGLLHNCVG